MRRRTCFNSGGVNFLDLPFEFHIRAWDGINTDGSGNFVSLTDLTGNGYTFFEETATLGTSPIEIVSNAIGSKQGLRFDGTNQIYSDVLWTSSVHEIFLFIVFKVENTGIGTNPRRFISVENSRLSEGNRYGIIDQSGVIQSWCTNATNQSTTATFSGNHYGWLMVDSVGTTDLAFAIDGETTITTPITNIAAGFNNAYCAIGGNRNRYTRILFCEAMAMLGNFDLLTPELFSAMADYVNDTYGF